MGRISEDKFAFLRRSIRIWLLKLLRKKNVIGQAHGEAQEEDNAMLEQKFRQWEQEFIQKGMLAGKEKGRAEGLAEGLSVQRTTLLEMLLKRFGKVPSSWAESINSMTNSAIISHLTISILSVNTPEEFGRLLQERQCN